MQRLVVLGGGYGGLKIVSTMLEQWVPDDVHITIIDKNPYHSLKTEFYTIAAGTVADNDVRREFPQDKHINYVFSEIEEIDTENQQIILTRAIENIDYDYLVVGLGCEDNYHGIE